MSARMSNPAMVVPGAMQALIGLSKTIAKTGVPNGLLELLYLRASQINGCSVCVDMHAHDLKAAGESDQRLFAVAAWRDAPYFSEAERAALALTEAATRLSDRENPVPDEVWSACTKHFDEQEIAGIVLGIAQINVWNRLNVSTKQVAGAVSR